MICLRAMDLAIFFAFFNVAIGLMNFMVVTYPDYSALDNNNTHQFMGQVATTDAQALQQSTKTSADEMAGTDGSQNFLGWFSGAFQGLFKMASTILGVLDGMIHGTKIMCTMFGLPTEIGDMVQNAVYLIYALAVAQWWSGRSTKEAS